MMGMGLRITLLISGIKSQACKKGISFGNVYGMIRCWKDCWRGWMNYLQNIDLRNGRRAILIVVYLRSLGKALKKGSRNM